MIHQLQKVEFKTELQLGYLGGEKVFIPTLNIVNLILYNIKREYIRHGSSD